jgi:hypothetical protein
MILSLFILFLLLFLDSTGEIEREEEDDLLALF